jgi:hypothetical protein
MFRLSGSEYSPFDRHPSAARLNAGLVNGRCSQSGIDAIEARAKALGVLLRQELAKRPGISKS